MSDLGLGWTDPPTDAAATLKVPVRNTIDVLIDNALFDFARRVRAVSRNSVKVRKICDEVLRQKGTGELC